MDVTFDAWRPGDQRVYISDIRRAQEVLGWRPTTDVGSGVAQLVDWVGAQPYLVP